MITVREEKPLGKSRGGKKAEKGAKNACECKQRGGRMIHGDSSTEKFERV